MKISAGQHQPSIYTTITNLLQKERVFFIYIFFFFTTNLQKWSHTKLPWQNDIHILSYPGSLTTDWNFTKPQDRIMHTALWWQGYEGWSRSTVPPVHGPVHTPEIPCIIEGLVCQLTLCILEQMICIFTNTVQISLIPVFALRFQNLPARNSSLKIFKHEKEEKLVGPKGKLAGPAQFLVAEGLGPALNAKTVIQALK